MSVTGMDGFSFYERVMGSGAGGPVEAGHGRDGNSALHFTDHTSYDYYLNANGSSAFTIVGGWFKGGVGGVWSSASQDIILFQRVFDARLSVATGASGGLEVWRDSPGTSGTPTLLGSVAAVFPDPDTYYFVETRADWAGTASIEIRVMGTTVLTLTGLGLTSYACDFIDFAPQFYQGSPTPCDLSWDDVYTLDDAGGHADDFLGPSIIDRLNPTGLGIVGGADSDAIDDPLNDDAATSIYFPKLTQEQWDMSNLTSGYAPVAVQADWNATAVNLGFQGIVYTMFNTNSSTWTDPGAGLHFPYGDYRERQLLVEFNPITSAPWTITEINALQMGLQIGRAHV